MQLAKLGPVHIQDIYNGWAVRRDGKAGGLSPRTRRHIHCILSAACGRGTEHLTHPLSPELGARRDRDYLHLAMPDVAPRLEPYLVLMTLPSADLVPGGGDRLGPYYDQLASGFAAAGACWRELKRQRDVFDQLYHELEENGSAAGAIRALAAELEEHEHRVAAEYVPGLQQIAGRLPHYHQRKRRDRSAQSIARLGEEIIEIGTTWLELLQYTRLRLLRLASVRDGESPSPAFSDPAAAKDYLAVLAG